MATTTTSETSKKLSRLFAVMIVVGIIMALFGYFGPFAKNAGDSFDSGASVSSLAKDSEAMKEAGRPPIKGIAPLKFFVKATFILGIVTIVWFVLLCVLYIDNPELIYLVIGGLTFLSSILTLIFACVVRSYIDSLASQSVVLGYGAIFLPIGGSLLGLGTGGKAFTTPKEVSLHQK